MSIETITVNGIEITYRDSGGTGPVLLFSSGISQSREFWDRQFETLGDAYRLIAWDYPNHGESALTGETETSESYARYLVGFMDELSVSEAVLVGNSLGGAVSVNVCAMAPERVKGLILAAPAFMGGDVFFPFRLMTLPLLGKLMTKPSDKGFEMQLSGVFHPSFVVPSDIRDVVRRNTFKSGAADAFLATMRGTLTLSGVRKSIWTRHRALLQQVKCPVLFIHGREDQILPYEQSVQCAQIPALGRVEIFDACGHAPQLEKPQRFNTLISEFCAAL